MKQILRLAIWLCISRTVMAGCAVADIQATANMCLHDNHVQEDTEFLIPVFNGSAGVINFCATINDIQSCISNVISACASDKKIHQTFGNMGAAISAAYVGICKEQNPNTHLTCAYKMESNISSAVRLFVNATDEVHSQHYNHDSLCGPLHALRADVLSIFALARQNGDCSEHDETVIHKYMSTIMFPCDDVGTDYYPCTLERVMVDALECYTSNHVSVKNALVPVPVSLSHADEMCNNKGMVQSCVKNLISKCVYEPQITNLFGTAADGFSAGYNCMCQPEHFDMILTCATSADVQTPMNQFTASVHKLNKAGTHSKQEQCSLQNQMKMQIQRSLDASCTDPSTISHWKTYMDTLEYPCTDQATACFPKNNYNGAPSNESSRALFLLFLNSLVLRVFM